ncbi:uncharacterized protein K452DRAFT_109960 [Aplosporella prunicola CBS 121167]|uniref:F-box domain-containing protein n=1 Tax=Aplosporella prunicola CBS 121167 TaxID=1176127 RepID=A0A6A6BUB4_9PEZI|nr:uncharacterized protein K452DRAFT_109960 [Aplosporella prunicola CBS 121167]KAF2146397.1 hypothetical protein K452DRAFT_109960 [Aplosporella prunicola CBS 121167]
MSGLKYISLIPSTFLSYSSSSLIADMSLQLLDIPAELISLIVERLVAGENTCDEELIRYELSPEILRSLRNLRLTCRHLSAIATPVLFERVGLYPEDDSVTRYKLILGEPELRKHVRFVHINTLDKGERERENEGEAVVSKRYRQALLRFNEFPHLKAVKIQFSPNCSDSHSLYAPSCWPQTIAFREPILEDFIRTLADPLAQNVTDITFGNLQNVNHDTLMHSAEAKKVLARATSLTLNIVTERYEAAPEYEIILEELHTFFEQLPSQWLSPATANLKRLVLHCDCYFGYLPNLDLNSVHFPALETLSLSKYTFAQDKHVDWITSHTRLRRLYLQDCSILVFRVVYDPFFVPASNTNEVRLGTRRPTGRGRRGRAQQYTKLRWDDILTRFQNRLPKLREFRVGTNHFNIEDVYDTASPEVYENMAIGLFRGRYTWFDGDWFKKNCPVIPHKRNFLRNWGELTPEAEQFLDFVDPVRQEEQDEKDKGALMGLLEAIGMKVPRGDESWDDRIFDLLEQ